MTTRGKRIGSTLAGIALLTCLAASRTAWADNKKDAQDKFKEGVALFKAEKFEEALAAFLASNELFSHPDTLVNVANCYAELYNFAKAMEYFEEYVQAKGSDLTAQQKKDVDAKMERIGKKVGKVTFVPETVSGSLFVDGDEAGKLPLVRPMYLESGLHTIVVKEAGAVVFTEQVNVVGGSKTAVDVSKVEMEEEEAEVEEVEGEGEGEGEEGEEGEAPPPKPKKAKKKKGALVVEVEGEEVGTVVLDGEEEGQTPYEIQLKEGLYALSVTAADKPTWSGEVPVESAKYTKVKVDFNSTKKVPNPNNPMFWASIGVLVPTAVSALVFGIVAKQTNDDANALYEQLQYSPPTDPAARAAMTQKQNDLVDKGEEQKKSAIGFGVVAGVAAIATVVAPFVFWKQKPAAKGTFEVSGVAPVVDPETTSMGMSLSGTF